jgi:ketosteroid isomerase-like protein
MIKPPIKQLARLDNFILIAFFLLTLASCSNEAKKEATTSTADLIAAANELDSLFIVAFNNGDAEAMMKLYWNSPDLRAYFPTEMQLKGYDAVKAAYIKDFATNKGAKLEYISSANVPFADGVVGHGIFRITMPMEGGEPMVFEGRFTEVKAMKDGKMVFTLDHASVPMMPPPADTTQTK